jgi:MoaA/NifB/PqqE/SkfB family radical SAM enzyme
MRSLLARIPAFRLARRLGRPLVLPASLTVSVLYACNSRCKTCHVYENKAKVLRPDEYDRIFASLGHAPRWVTLSGGEPFLRKDLGDIALLLWKHCRPKVINLPTNGSLPDAVEATVERVTAEAKGTAFVVNLSIDEVGPRHDELRGFPGSYERALETLNRLRRLKARRKNLTLGIHTVVSAYNEARFEEIADHCRSLGPDSYIVEVAEQRVELGTVKDALAPSDEGLQRALGNLRRHSRRARTAVEALVASLRQEYYAHLERYAKQRRELLPCFAAITSAHLMPEGKLWACCILGETLGNLREADYDFPTVWYSTQANAIRARIKREQCHCPLANQAYLNMLVDPKSLARVAARSARAVLR